MVLLFVSTSSPSSPLALRRQHEGSTARASARRSAAQHSAAHASAQHSTAKRSTARLSCMHGLALLACPAAQHRLLNHVILSCPRAAVAAHDPPLLHSIERARVGVVASEAAAASAGKAVVRRHSAGVRQRSARGPQQRLAYCVSALQDMMAWHRTWSCIRRCPACTHLLPLASVPDSLMAGAAGAKRSWCCLCQRLD
jgi:hypothetical protein